MATTTTPTTTAATLPSSSKATRSMLSQPTSIDDTVPLLPLRPSNASLKRRRRLRAKQLPQDDQDHDEEDWTEGEDEFNASSAAPSLPSLLDPALLQNPGSLHPPPTTSPSPVTPTIAVDGVEQTLSSQPLPPSSSFHRKRSTSDPPAQIVDSTSSGPGLAFEPVQSAAQEFQRRTLLQHQQRLQMQQIQQAQQAQQRDSQQAHTLRSTTPSSAPATQTSFPHKFRPTLNEVLSQAAATTSTATAPTTTAAAANQKQFKARDHHPTAAAMPGWRTTHRVRLPSVTATDSETDEDGLHSPALVLAPSSTRNGYTTATYIAPAPRSKKSGGSRGHTQTPPLPPHPRGVQASRSGLKSIPRLAGLNFLPSRRRTRRPDATPGAFLETLSDMEDTSAMPVLKRVSAFCVAQAFEWTSIVGDLARMRATHTHLSDDVVRIHIPGWPQDGDAFLFGTYGVVIFWAMEEHQEDKFLTAIRGWLDDDNLLGEDEEKDSFTWFYDPSASGVGFSIWNNCFILPNATNPEDDALNRLAVAYSIATSVKLDTFEVAIEKTITATQGLPLELANQGRMTLSKREVSKYIGELYIQKSSVNLVHDILDTPNFPDYPQDLERMYLKCRKFLNIDTRCEVLNKRLDVLAELLEILRSEKAEQHSSRLEWIVIFLIVVEVVLGVMDLVNSMGL